MLCLIAYDIADPRRLRKVSRLCLDYGIRIEYSVFECKLEDKIFNAFWTQLVKIVDPRKDRCIACRLCADCVRHVRRIGNWSQTPGTKLYLI